MKSLNRTLSLVLVLVMVLGLVGISAGASFKDEAKINYKEAVGVMTGIGALVGYPDGTFNGAGTVTREEAVKTVVYAVLGADVAKNLAGTATGFADVDAGRWSAGVIAYAVSRGIVNGRDAKTFDPTGNVTANEVGKMMLCAAGYGAKGEFIGSSWELNTAVLANKTGIFADSKAASHSTPATREETALYTFNGIQTQLVAYNKLFEKYEGETIKVDGVDTDATTMNTVYSALKATTTTDGLGRAATLWTYKGKEIGKYTNAAALTYTKFMNTTAGKKTLTNDLKNYTLKGNSVPCTVDGIPAAPITGTVSGTVGTPNATTIAALAALTGNGRIVTLYADDTTKPTEISGVSVINTEIAQIAKINSSTKTVTVKTMDQTHTYTADSDNATYNALVALGEKALVLVNPVAAPVNAVANIAVPTVVTGKISNIAMDSDVIVGLTFAGKAYELSANAVGFENLGAGSINAAKDSTLIVDSLGYAIGIKDTVATTNYVVAGTLYDSLVNGKIVKMLNGIALDGSAMLMNLGTTNQSVASGSLYTYASANATVAAQGGDTTLTAVTATTSATTAGSIALTNGKSIGASDVRLTATNASGANAAVQTAVFAPDVKFIYLKDIGVSNYVLSSVKTGVQPTALVTGDIALYTGSAATGYSVSAVIIHAEDANTTGASVAYVSEKTGITTVGAKSADIYTMYIDGAETKNVVSTDTGLAGKFVTYAKDEKTGNYTLKAYASTTSATSTMLNGVISATAGKRLITVDDGTTTLTDANAKDAVIVDLTGKGITSVSDIADAMTAGKTVVINAVYNGLSGATNAKFNTVSYIFVTYADTIGITAANIDATSFAFDKATNKYVLVGAATKTAKFELTGLPTGATVGTVSNQASTNGVNVNAAGTPVTLTILGTGNADATITITVTFNGGGHITLTPHVNAKNA